MHKAQEQVRELHRDVIGAPTSPAEPKFRNPALRARLILEEAFETACALVGVANAQTIATSQMLQVSLEKTQKGDTGPNLVEAVDGCMDVLVVTYGTMEDIGLDAEPFYDEVHRSNMAKVGGPVDAEGKKGKPAGWTPPDIAGVLERVMKVREMLVHRRAAALKQWSENEQLGAPPTEYTCDDCGVAPTCEYVYDNYNTNGDCLAEK